MNLDPNFLIHDEAALRALYGEPGEASIVKEKDHITPEYRALIAASPFAVLATSGPDGLDASPRGDLPHLVTVEDEKTILMPDRRGNNRIDTLRNIVSDPRVALLFLIPGSGTTLRVNGIALVSVDPTLIARFTVEGKAPRSLVVIKVETVFFQCARAVIRAALWDPAHHHAPESLPSAEISSPPAPPAASTGRPTDEAWPARAKATMY